MDNSKVEDVSLLMCTRCKTRVRASQMTGCLCDKCEEAIEDMTQEQLDADWVAHGGDPDGA